MITLENSFGGTVFYVASVYLSIGLGFPILA